MSHKAFGLGKGERAEASAGWKLEISTCLSGGVLLWNGLINCVQANMTTWVRSYLRSHKWGVGTLSFTSPLPMDRENKRYCYRWNMEWEREGTLFFFCASPVVNFIFFFIRHANTPVPSMQRNCFAGCDGRITWWQQSNFHMNNYPAVRVGSSFISIWWTRRIILTKACERGPLYSGQWAQAGDWQTWAISAESCCPGLNMPTPLKLAHEPSILCSPNRPRPRED